MTTGNVTVDLGDTIHVGVIEHENIQDAEYQFLDELEAKGINTENFVEISTESEKK